MPLPLNVHFGIVSDIAGTGELAVNYEEEQTEVTAGGRHLWIRVK